MTKMQTIVDKMSTTNPNITKSMILLNQISLMKIFLNLRNYWFKNKLIKNKMNFKLNQRKNKLIIKLM